MVVTTDAIQANGFFDPRYTCDFDNSSPELRWKDPPEEAAAFVVTFMDLDASGGAGNHWVVYNIPAAVRHLPAGIPPQDSLPNGIRQGINSFGKLGYSGPCPPIGDKVHRYVLRVYALRIVPEIPNRATEEQLVPLISPFTIVSAEVTGRYQRAVQRAG